MPRSARIVATNFPHHVTQRGNYGQIVFEDDNDRRFYLNWLKEYSEKYSLNIWAYCLMSNHVHFVVVPLLPDSLSRTFYQAHMQYSQYFNKKKEQSGHLWQGRFYSCCLDEPHLLAAIRYVENNPVRAGLVKKAEYYVWSSARNHINGKENPILSGDLPLLEQIPDWRAFLQLVEEEKLIKEIRMRSKSGAPAGSKEFIKKLELLTGKKINKI